MTTGLIAEQPKPTALFVLTTPNLLCIPKKSLDSPNTETFKRLGLPGDPIEFASQSQRGQLSFPAYLSIHSTSNNIHTVRWEFRIRQGWEESWIQPWTVLFSCECCILWFTSLRKDWYCQLQKRIFGPYLERTAVTLDEITRITKGLAKDPSRFEICSDAVWPISNLRTHRSDKNFGGVFKWDIVLFGVLGQAYEPRDILQGLGVNASRRKAELETSKDLDVNFYGCANSITDESGGYYSTIRSRVTTRLTEIYPGIDRHYLSTCQL